MGGRHEVPDNYGYGSRFGAEEPWLLGGRSAGSSADWVRDRIRVRRCSVRSKQADSDWIKRFVIFAGKARQSALSAVGLTSFLAS